MSNVTKIAANALRTVSSQLRKFESESEMLRRKVAELESKRAEEEKTARARKLAMEMILDEQAISDINDKVASFKDKNLDVVEEAIKLNNLNKVASLGETETEDDKPSDLFTAVQTVLLNKKG